MKDAPWGHGPHGIATTPTEQLETPRSLGCVTGDVFSGATGVDGLAESDLSVPAWSEL